MPDLDARQRIELVLEREDEAIWRAKAAMLAPILEYRGFDDALDAKPLRKMLRHGLADAMLAIANPHPKWVGQPLHVVHTAPATEIFEQPHVDGNT